MKKWWLVLMLFFSSLTLKKKKIPDPNMPTINITQNQVVNGWAKFKTECLGCVSFYYQIRRTAGMYSDGKYYFYIYLHSNSYSTAGFQAATYLRNIKFYMNNNLVFNLDYVLVEPGGPQHVAWLTSPDPMTLVTFTWENSIVY